MTRTRTFLASLLGLVLVTGLRWSPAPASAGIEGGIRGASHELPRPGRLPLDDDDGDGLPGPGAGDVALLPRNERPVAVATSLPVHLEVVRVSAPVASRQSGRGPPASLRTPA